MVSLSPAGAGLSACSVPQPHLIHAITCQYFGHPQTIVVVAVPLVVYLRRCGDDPQLSPWLEGRNHIHPVVHRVQDAIAADFTRCWTLSELARMAGASKRHLSRLFHEHVGMSVVDYTLSLRVATARDLLHQTSLDMERVAEQAGFSSARQLRRAWHKLYETPPREARVRSSARALARRKKPR